MDKKLGELKRNDQKCNSVQINYVLAQEAKILNISMRGISKKKKSTFAN